MYPLNPNDCSVRRCKHTKWEINWKQQQQWVKSCEKFTLTSVCLFVHRITNLQTKQSPLIQPPQRSTAAQGAVQMRIKSSQSSGDRLSQSKSMVLQESDLPQKPVSTYQESPSYSGSSSVFNWCFSVCRSLGIAEISLSTTSLSQEELPLLNHWWVQNSTFHHKTL